MAVWPAKFSDITPQVLQYFWKPVIPFGKVTLIQGDTGIGKTSLILKILADVSNGYVAFGNSGGLYHSCGAYFANYEKWMSWPEEVQDLVRAAFRKGGRFNCERDVAATEEFALSEQEAGKVINRIVEADMQPWYDLGQESLELWKADVEEMGLDAQAILDGYLAQVDEYFATHEQ